MEKVTKKEKRYPHELISLPSQGKLYPEDSPLATGEISIKLMTAREEDILTSQNLITKGVVLDVLLESIVLDVNPDELLIGDKNAILLASRIMAYGPEYKVGVMCPSCGEPSEETIDLSLVEPQEYEIEPENGNSFQLELPQSGKVITFKILNHGDEKKLEKEIEAWSKINKKQQVNPELSTRYRYMITSVDGETDPRKIKSFIQNEFTIRDGRTLRAEYKKVSPDMSMEFNFECDNCGTADRVGIPIGANFFWPTEEL